MAAALAQTNAMLAARTVKAPASRSFCGQRLVAPSNGTRVFAKVGNWLPGSDTPAYLDDLPGSFGFDPLGLSEVDSNRQRFQEAELIHCRWAMAGAAGVLAVEALGFGDWYSAPTWAVNGGTATWAGIPVPFNIGTVTAAELVLMAGAEAFRANEQDSEKRKYPGGAFDPFGLSKDPKGFEDFKLKEIKNGRLAMIAMLGFFAQHAATGKTPLTALGEHLANPWGANFATNGVSLPGFS